MRARRITHAALCCALFAAQPFSASAAPRRIAIQSHQDIGGKCIDVPYAKFFQGMRVQLWTCESTVTWGQPNTDVTVGIIRKSGPSDIRVRLGETATDGPAAQAFSYDEASQQLQIGGLCLESWGRGDPQDAVGLGACEGKANQRWKMTASGNYSQIAGTNVLCLEPRNGAKENGAPLDLAKCDGSKTDQLWFLKTPTRGVLGVKWRKPTDDEMSSLPLEKGTGVIIEKVLQGGPAEKSGLLAGDAIATVDGRAIRTPAEMPAKPSGKATGCSRYMPSVGLTVPVPCDEY